MAQMSIRQIDDEAYARLKARARAERTTAEALARDAIHRAAQLTVDEKLALVREMQEWSRKSMVPGVPQTPGLELIREARDHDR
jgi:plasmid stability protein